MKKDISKLIDAIRDNNPDLVQQELVGVDHVENLAVFHHCIAPLDLSEFEYEDNSAPKIQEARHNQQMILKMLLEKHHLDQARVVMLMVEVMFDGNQDLFTLLYPLAPHASHPSWIAGHRSRWKEMMNDAKYIHERNVLDAAIQISVTDKRSSPSKKM